MNKYEAVIIFTDKFNDETAEKAIVKYSKILHKYSPEPIKTDNIGIRPLAYPIHKRLEGWYVIFRFQGTPDNVSEFERLLRIDDDVLKFLTVKTEDDDEAEDYEETEDHEDMPDSPDENPKSEQMEIDAEDVLLGLAQYN